MFRLISQKTTCPLIGCEKLFISFTPEDIRLLLRVVHNAFLDELASAADRVMDGGRHIISDERRSAFFTLLR